MNIRYVERLYRQANELRLEGVYLVAANIYLIVMVLANQTRSSKRFDIRYYAYSLVLVCSEAIMADPFSSHSDRMKANRIIKECHLLFREGI